MVQFKLKERVQKLNLIENLFIIEWPEICKINQV